MSHYNKLKIAFLVLTLLILSAPAAALASVAPGEQAADAERPFLASADPPASPVKLIFIHHSTGGYWLANDNGGLGQELMDNNYYVSATNYSWGPYGIGDRTDILNWPTWFIGVDGATILAALYNETGQNVGGYGAWSRLAIDPGGENEIIVFKSCFPNSNLDGNPEDPPAPSPGPALTVSNAKAVYNDILTYFETRQDKLFIVVTAPPLVSAATTVQRAANARAFNNWLVNDWLDDYSHNNVAVFDFYNVLTSNGGSPATTDQGLEIGNHHRWWNGVEQHIQTVDQNTAAYPSGDSHPNQTGNLKATAEFVPLLNVFYHRWHDGATAVTFTRFSVRSVLPSASPVLLGILAALFFCGPATYYCLRLSRWKSLACFPSVGQTAYPTPQKEKMHCGKTDTPHA